MLLGLDSPVVVWSSVLLSIMFLFFIFLGTFFCLKCNFLRLYLRFGRRHIQGVMIPFWGKIDQPWSSLIYLLADCV